MVNSNSQTNLVALQLRLDAEATPGDLRSITWRQAADLIERQSGPAESECHRVLRIIATTSITYHGKYIENCAAVFQQMAKNALAKSDATDSGA